MLQDIVYTDSPLTPEIAEDKKIKQQIKYLENTKADCVNICGCNTNGYITFQIDGNGNERITGSRYFSTPLCGIQTVETALSQLLAEGHGELATCVLVSCTSTVGPIASVGSCNGQYVGVCYYPNITTDGNTLTSPGLCSSTATITTVCNTTLNGYEVNATSICGDTVCASNYVQSECLKSNDALSVCASCDIVFTYNCYSSCLCKDNGYYYGDICSNTGNVSTLCSSCANITSASITNASITNLSVGSFANSGPFVSNNGSGLLLCSSCTDGTVWMANEGISISNCTGSPSCKSTAVGYCSCAGNDSVAIGYGAKSDYGIAIGCGAITTYAKGYQVLKHLRYGNCGGEITFELSYPGGYPFRCDFFTALNCFTGNCEYLWFTGTDLILGNCGSNRCWVWSGVFEGYKDCNGEIGFHHIDDGSWYWSCSTCMDCMPYSPDRIHVYTLTYSNRACTP